MEDALDEVLAEHFRALLQQQVEEAVFAQTETGGEEALSSDVTANISLYHRGSIPL